VRIPRLYVPVPLHSGANVTLDQNTANHAVRVLRLAVGAPLILFNGEGGEYEGLIDSINRHSVTITVGEFHDEGCESPLDITLVQGVSRGERMDYTLQKAVELGVTRIMPVLSERSVVKLAGERLQRRLHHWQGVVTSACEQCGRDRVPKVRDIVALKDWLPTTGKGLKLVLQHNAEHSLSAIDPTPGPITLLIGPEGGLSDAEIQGAVAAGFVPLRLGPRVLRTETAAVVALTALQTLWGDLG